MFGKRKQSETPKQPAPGAEGAPGNPFSDNNKPEPASDGGRKCAAYETLGQTLVVTVISEVLSGSDARTLVRDISSRSAYAADIGDKPPTMEPDGPQKPRHFVLDLQNVEYMDSACLGTLVELLTAMQSRGGRIALVNAGRNVEYLFRLTQLDRLFPICRDTMTAIEAVERGPSEPLLGAAHKKRKKKSA